MTTPVSRDTVLAFVQAFASGDPAQIEPLLHDNVRWNIVGPVELIRFCGEWRGKAKALDVFAKVVPSVVTMGGYDLELLLVDGDRCVTLARISDTKSDIGYRCTQFVRFQDDKVIEISSNHPTKENHCRHS